MTKFKFIDLFCGTGGFHQALSSLGGECVYASDIDADCRKTYYKNYGIMPDGDITKVDAKDIPQFDVLCGGFPCLTADSLVCTNKGYKKIVDVEPNDTVLSHDGKYHKIEALIYQGVKTIYNIKTSGMVNVSATNNHKFYVRKKIIKGSKRTFTVPEWKTVEEIMMDKDGIYMFGSPINKIEEIPDWNGINVWENQIKQKILKNLDMTDPLLWYILGRFIGDGWVRKNFKKGDKRAKYSGIIICCNKNETEELKKIIGDKYHYTISQERTVDKFHFTNTELGYFASQFGQGASEKVIPAFVQNLPKKLLKEFIKGYEDSDGYVKYNIHCIASINVKLLYGIAHCIEKVYNVPCKIRKTHKSCKGYIEGRLCNINEGYTLEYRLYSKRSKHFIDDNIIWYPISSIIESGENDVYDIQVENTHTFVVNHSITHNCQAFSIAGNKLGFNDKTKGTLFFDICRILEYHKPKYALLENVRNIASHDNGKTWETIYTTLDELGYNVFKKPSIFSPHFIGIPQNRERVFIMCVRKDIGELPPFHFNTKNIKPCSIDTILLNDEDIEDISHYKLRDDQIEWIDNWNEFIQNIKCDKLPGFNIWSECFCPLEENPYYNDMDKLPDWKKDTIMKNYKLWEDNKEFLTKWLEKAKKNKNFFGSKAKLEWQAGDMKNPNIWDCIMQIRQSGLRVKKGTYFPALVAVTQTSIVGKRKRFLTQRECARLQSLPDTFIYDEKEKEAFKQLGNGVNVEVVKLFARYLLGDKDVQNEYSFRNQYKDIVTSKKLF
jgi:DNA (cytosine-5)-methyltransferase 1